MPGPGGGGFGGGGHGGFSGGRGGFSGGHGGFYPRLFWFPFGGCLGGLGSLFLAPFLMLTVAVILLVNLFTTGLGSLWTGGSVVYDEATFQDYADAQYAAVYGETSAYEDGLLLVVLVDENYENYDYIAWVGDHVRVQVSDLFGNEHTAFGQTMNDRIAIPYRYALDSNLSAVMDRMAVRIEALSLPSSFVCEEAHNQVDSRLINRSALPMTAETVDAALADFTARTGITVNLVVAEREAVFGRTMPWVQLIFSLLLLALAVFWIVRTVRQRKRDDTDNPGSYNGWGGDRGNPRYW